jgi:type VI secretion system secreted protein VgrG
VKANTGGAPGVGTGINILAPVIPIAAAIGSVGQLLERKIVPEKTEHDLDFLVTSQETGLPLKNFPYVIKTSSGKSIVGRTNDEGRTAKISSTEAETAVIEVYDDIPPINPGWDD